MNGKCLAAKRFIGTGKALRPLVGQVLVARMALYISPMSPKAGLTTKVLVPTLRVVVHFVTLRVTQFCDSVRFRLDLSHLFAPRRPTFDGAEVGKSLRSCFRPDFVGFLRPVTDPGGAATGIHGPMCVKTSRAKARQGKNRRKRPGSRPTLGVLNEHFSPVFNAVLPSAVVFTQPGPGAASLASCQATPGSAPGLSRRLRRTLRRQVPL